MILFTIYSSYDDYKDKSMNETASSIFNYLLGSSILGQHLIKDYIYKTIEDVKPYLVENEAIIENEEIKNEFESLKKQGLVTKEFEKFYDRCIDIMSEFRIERTQLSKDDEKYIKNISHFIKFITILSKETQRTNIDTGVLKKINIDLEDFLSSYGSANQELVDSVVDPILMYLSSNGKDDKLPPFNSIFLTGNPGVGKTRFVTEIVKKIDANIEYFKLDEKSDRYDDDRVRIHKDFKEQSDKFSAITNLILKSKKDPNKINFLFIDEIDKILKSKKGDQMNEILLKLLGSSEEKIIKDSFLGIDLVVPKNIVVICASNASLHSLAKINKKFNPLKSRFVEILIPDLSKELQYELTVKYMKELYYDITDFDKSFIKKVVYESKYSGMRELKLFINLYVQKKKSIDILKNIKKVEDISIFQKKYIENMNKPVDLLDTIEKEYESESEKSDDGE